MEDRLIQLEEKLEELEDKLESSNKEFGVQKEKVEDIEKENELRKRSPVLDRNLDVFSKQVIKDTIKDSIIDIVWNDYFYYSTYFESLDGWNLVDSSSGTTSLVSRLGVHLVSGDSPELNYDTQTGNFTIGQIVTGTTSGAYGEITGDVDNGDNGTLSLKEITGTFAAAEAITDPLGGAAQTGTGITNVLSSIDKEPVYQNVLSFDMLSRFSSAFFVTGITYIEAFFGIGFVNAGATSKHYGFYIEDATLKGTCANGTTQSTIDLMTISTNSPTTVDPIYFCEAHFFPGSKIEFFVREDSGLLVGRGTLTTNLPSGAMYEWLSAMVTSRNNAEVDLRFSFMEYIQKREIK